MKSTLIATATAFVATGFLPHLAGAQSTSPFASGTLTIPQPRPESVTTPVDASSSINPLTVTGLVTTQGIPTPSLITDTSGTIIPGLSTTATVSPPSNTTVVITSVTSSSSAIVIVTPGGNSTAGITSMSSSSSGSPTSSASSSMSTGGAVAGKGTEAVVAWGAAAAGLALLI